MGFFFFFLGAVLILCMANAKYDALTVNTKPLAVGSAFC